MSNPSKQKGTSCEREVVEYLRAHGFEACERRALAGGKDRGDVAGIPGWVAEIKNCKTLDLAGWADETERERVNDNARYGLTVIRRRMKPIGKAYAMLPLEQMVALIYTDVFV